MGEVEEEKDVVVKTEQAQEGAEGGSGADVTLQSVERQHILQSLARNGGNRTATAVELGISRRTLQYKLLEYARDGFAVD